MICLLERSNCVIFIPDNKDYLIDINSDLGWYVLYSDKLTKPFLYNRKTNNQYIGYSTSPLFTECSTPILDDFGTGKCELIYCKIQDSPNNAYTIEKHPGTQGDTFYYIGHIKYPKDVGLNYNSQQYYAFAKSLGYFDYNDTNFDSQDLTDTSFLEVRYRFTPAEQLIPNKIFGIPIEITGKKITTEKPKEAIISTGVTMVLTRNIDNHITNINLSSATKPFYAVLRNTGTRKDITYNVFASLVPDVGTVEVSLDSVYAFSGDNFSMNIAVTGGDEDYFEPVLLV